MEGEYLETLFALVVFCCLFLIVFLRRRREAGKRWDGLEHAVVTIEGKELACSHCGHNFFSKREGLLATKFVTLFNFSFLNRSARCFSCRKCGFVHWFLRTEEYAEQAEITRDPDWQ